MIEMYDWRKSIGSEMKFESDELYDIAFTSGENLDDRSDWSITYLQKVAKAIVTVEYLHSNVSLAFNNEPVFLRDIGSINYIGKKILIDATSLAFPEILHLFSIFERDMQKFDVIYAQPLAYKKDSEEKHLNDVETFSLSDDGIGPKQLQPFINYSDDIHLAVCLGFEGHRFGALINSEEFNISKLSYILGVPAFKPGWECQSLANNYKMMMDIGVGMDANYKIAPANDPVSIYGSIELAYRSAQYLQKTFFLAPFGTKPAGVAAANFAVNTKKLVVVYDFVKKRKQRSSGTDLIHLWRYQSV